MKIAYVCSNVLPIHPDTKKGTEIFNRILLNALARLDDDAIDMTVFASGDSAVPFPLHSIHSTASRLHKDWQLEKHILFELSLISEAIRIQDEFDVFHFNIGNGDIVMPFLQFIHKPVVITAHYTFEDPYVKEFFSRYTHFNNVNFVTASKLQAHIAPPFSHRSTIYHGIEIDRYAFDPDGGSTIFWAGRGIAEKGLPATIEVARRSHLPLTLSVIRIADNEKWLDEILARKTNNTRVLFDTKREEMIPLFQNSKVFLFPVEVEEPFGLVAAESMACGTPVVAYARGALPEIIEDGVTGFLVEPEGSSHRSRWKMKEKGIEGLNKAVQTIMQMPVQEYREMRRKVRERAEKLFSDVRMAHSYISLYKSICKQ